MTQDSCGLSNKVIILTGSCGDIGSATTQKLAALGAQVIGFDLLEEDAGKKHIQQFGGIGYRRIDQGNAQELQQSIPEVAKEFGRLDLVIGNAAVGSVSHGLLDCSAEDWESLLRVNLIGCAMLAQSAVKQMLDQTPDADGIRGRILFTSSWVGTSPFPGCVDYCSSKAALDHLIRLIAQEFASRGIRANAVAPGILDAGLSRVAMEQKPELRETMCATIPVGSFGTAEQVADALAFLCSRQSNYMTGHILFVDGGCTLTKRE